MKSLLRLLCSSAVLLLVALCSWTSAYAQLTPSGDAYTNTATPTSNFGAKTLLDVQSASQTTYIQFDLSALPSGYTSANITKATLKLYVNSVTTAGSFNVDFVNGTWAENTINANNAPALGSTIAASVPLTTAEKNQYVLIDITSAVGAWLNGTDPNDGIALVGNSPLNATFDSKENTTTSHPAELDIVFTGGGTITGVTTASGSGLTGGGTSGTLNLALTNACAANQVLQWNGSSWACASVGMGTITGVTAGTDLTGGGTSGSITLNLDITRVPQLGANTFVGTQAIAGANLALDQTTGASDGVVTMGGTALLHACCAAFAANTFLGLNAGNFTVSGSGNTAVGWNALTAETSGNANTALGTQALFSNSTGFQNTAVGNGALAANTGGGANAAIGVDALNGNTGGSNNSALGSNALTYNSTGAGNVAVGDLAGVTAAPGNANTTGSNNTFLGYKSGPGTATQLTNASAIGANALVSENNALVLGGTGANAVNVGIGTATPASTLDVHGTGNFTGLITFVAGQTFPGTGTVTSVGSGTGLTGGPITGSGTLSIAPNACAAGNALSALPFTCSPFATLGANAFTGDQTVNGNLSATGVVTGSSYQIGSNVFAFGSISNDNAFLGFAGNAGMTGVSNTAVGVAALGGNTTGNNNTAIGVFAGDTNGNTASWGSNNTFVGYNANFGPYNNLHNSTAIGALAQVTASNAMVLGSISGVNGATADALVGIGITAPTYKLHVGTINNGFRVEGPPTGGSGMVSASFGGNGDFGIDAPGTFNGRFVVKDTTGHVGIAAKAPTNIFTIGQGAGHAIADGWDTYSSRRWKTNIHQLQDALGKVQQLRGVSYDVRKSGKHEIGVIAEEVGKVVPEVVSYEPNGQDAQGVDYTRLTALLIEAVKEQQRQIGTQQQQIARLNGKVGILQAALHTAIASGKLPAAARATAVKSQRPTSDGNKFTGQQGN